MLLKVPLIVPDFQYPLSRDKVPGRAAPLSCVGVSVGMLMDAKSMLGDSLRVVLELYEDNEGGAFDLSVFGPLV